MWLLVFSLILFVRSTNECVATVPGGTVTTTSTTSTQATVTTTTTTAATTTTTTAANLACGDCTLTNPAIQVLRVSDGNKDITTDVLGVDANGCALRTITCAGTGPGNTVFLEWNAGAAGTTQGVFGANTVMDTMICDGTNWILTKNFYGPEEKRPITTVECTST